MVLVTLVYLAFQTQQNTMAIGAQLDAARINAVQNLNLAAATSSEPQEALNGDRNEPFRLECPAQAGACFFHARAGVALLADLEQHLANPEPRTGALLEIDPLHEQVGPRPFRSGRRTCPIIRGRRPPVPTPPLDWRGLQ